MSIPTARLVAALNRLWPGSVMPVGLPQQLGPLTTDSREVTTGGVFIAIPGIGTDGRDYIDQALAAGAVLVLAERDEDVSASGGEFVVWLDGLREQVGELSREVHQVPDELELIGVTGTNGKSSVTHYIAELSREIGVDTGVVGTLGHGRPGALVQGMLTTPEPLALQRQLGELAGQGITRVAMEVSSHALDQQRVAGCRFSAAVFTNLSRDHLDYHGSMVAYAAAKALLFKRSELTLAVVNGDDPLARLMLAGIGKDVRVLATGEDDSVSLRVVEWLPDANGQRALIATPEGEHVLVLPLMGRFNLDNVLLAMAALYGLGASMDALVAAAERLTPVPGRMQPLVRPEAPTVVIDYAHTPDALDNALQGLKAHLPGDGELWCLVGCGGDRDAGKRPLMAQAAARHADRVVITDDNPRTEDPETIREAMSEGLDNAARQRSWNIAGRGEAIARVIQQAGPDDVILIAGKGHETYQEIQGVRHAFSDLEEAQRALSLRTGAARTDEGRAE
ncbi:UDP-N-acetylmuramoyl-L-alanyl-D-glutamate--2,6-diaminopimelate ligase [Halomonas cupida]|uniref:UDP-N-acetylmuramoyl-L-alanyl-D-glutamate--2, 6-diaminopimelate ligase n=1 Tax=Halomonas cupida TaxID=44933 RepID=UPI003A8D3DC3